MKSKFLPFLLLLAVLPVLIFRDYTPSNELRYLSIVDEALRNGDIFTFTIMVFSMLTSLLCISGF